MSGGEIASIMDCKFKVQVAYDPLVYTTICSQVNHSRIVNFTMSNATLEVVAITIIITGIDSYFYYRLSPQPLPGIPYNIEATSHILEDIPARRAWYKNHGDVRRLYKAHQLRKS